MKYEVSHAYNAEEDMKRRKSQNNKRRRSSSTSFSDKPREDVDTVSFFTLFRYSTRKDKAFIFLAIIFSVACGCIVPMNTLLFSSVLEEMVKYGMQSITAEDFLAAVSRFSILNTILGVSLVILSYLATIFMNFATHNQIHKIRQEYLRAALNQDFEYYDRHQTGDFASKMSDDVMKLEDGIGEKLTVFIYYQASFVSCVVMALVIGWKLALLCLISFPVTLTLVGVTGLVASRLSKQETTAAGKASAVAEEVISSIHTVFAFGGQRREIARYDSHLKEMRRINVKKGLYNGMTMGFLFLCIFGTYAMSFWFGYQLMVNEGENYTVATMMAVFLGIIQGSASFGTSTILMEVFGTARGSGSHIFHLIDRVPTINPFLDRGIKPNIVTGKIKLENVTFAYPSRPDLQVLNSISFEVQQGQSVALVGHSGCGKSTIVQLISRYYDVATGSVSVDSHDVRELSIRWLRSQIGLVEQELVLFDTTVRENIRYGFEAASDKAIEDAARLANAHKFIMKLPKGYDTLVGERGASLSGGQKQRIAIARAMVRNPRILLLDEATSALDTASEAKVQKALDKAQQGRTTIIVAHRLSTIRHVDTIHVLKSGSIVESGNHEKLMAMKGLYYKMVMVQGGADLETDLETPQTPFLSTQSSYVDDDKDEYVSDKIQPTPEDKESSISFWRVMMLNSREWKSVTFASLCAFVSGFAMPLIGVIIGDFIGALSNPTPSEVLDAVKSVAIIFISLGFVTGVLNFCQVFFYAIAGEQLTRRLRKNLFAKYLSFEIAFFDDKSNSTGALCAKLSSEAASVQGATGQRIGTVLQAIGTFLFGLSLSLSFEWRIGLVVLTFVPVIGFILFKQVQMTSEESSTHIKTIEGSSKIAIDAVSNVRTVAAIGREQKFLEEYAAALYPSVLVAKRAAHWRGLVFGLSRGLFNFIYAVSIYYGATLMVNDGISYDVIFKAVQALLMGATSATQAIAFAPNFQKGIKAARRIMLLLRRPTLINDPEKPAIENFIGSGEAALQDVEFHYPTRPMVQVLRNFSLEVARGQTVALVGPSGSGKSTVVQLLVRFYDPDYGSVSLDRIPLPRLRVSDARKTLGIVSQMPVLFDRSIGDNIAYGDNSRTIKPQEIIDAAKQANIHNFITTLPEGYDTNVGSKGVQLSGGQKQRIAIARALLRQPKILLLDEATSALDTESEKVVQEALDVAKAGRTCVMIAHRLSTVRDADLICVIYEGRLIECGTHSQLMDLKGMYHNLHRHSH